MLVHRLTLKLKHGEDWIIKLLLTSFQYIIKNIFSKITEIQVLKFRKSNIGQNYSNQLLVASEGHLAFVACQPEILGKYCGHCSPILLFSQIPWASLRFTLLSLSVPLPSWRTFLSFLWVLWPFESVFQTFSSSVKFLRFLRPHSSAHPRPYFWDWLGAFSC